MNNDKFDIGMVGLGVMGRNLVLNMADNHYSVIGLDKDGDKVEALKNESSEEHVVTAVTSLDEFIGKLKKPRAVMMLVPAGKPVDSVIDELVPVLDKGDLIIDGGNSHFTDTNRRSEQLKEKGIHFIGVGISGGEKGARFGPSMMPGGSNELYSKVKPIFEAVAAKVDNDPCVTYLGPGSAGHYVKMVHNGIEYGLMQLLSETYDLMKKGLGLSNEELHEIFKKWNEEELQSFLVEITADIFKKKDDKADGYLVDHILDQARQKGTGKWTSQDAMELQAPVPTMDIAVSMRDMSGYKEERVAASKKLTGPDQNFKGDKQALIGKIKNALYFAFITTYAQGMAQLKAASEAYDYELHMNDIARIWRGGCIIRASLLEDIREAFTDDPELANLLVAPKLESRITERLSDIREVVKTGVDLGIPVPGLMVSLSYYDSYRSARLPANLLQAQRDDFGAHTYERVDREGIFHSEWS